MSRNAVSLLEVMFAIMIISVGLIMVAALLPLAARQANDSYSLARSTILASSFGNQVIASDRLVPNTNPWLVPDDVTNGRFETYVGLPASSLEGSYDANKAKWTTIRDLDGMSLVDHQSSFCIDPHFWSNQPDVDVGMVPRCDGSEGAYRRTRFPYYREDYNPAVHPGNSIGAYNPNNATPRMLRVSFAGPNSFGPLPLPMSEKLAAATVVSSDELLKSLLLGESESVPFIRESNRIKQASTGEFSWMITMTPNEFRALDKEADYYTMATIIFRNRPRGFLAGLRTTNDVAFDPENPPEEERICAVTGSTAGTLGGAGFGIQITSALAVNNRVRTGDWLMLSRRLSKGGQPHREVHRWYRITNVSDVTESSTTWSRDLYIAGSDWDFRIDPLIPNAERPQYATVATLVSNVVTVTERIVPYSSNL